MGLDAVVNKEDGPFSGESRPVILQKIVKLEESCLIPATESQNDGKDQVY